MMKDRFDATATRIFQTRVLAKHMEYRAVNLFRSHQAPVISIASCRDEAVSPSKSKLSGV